MFLPEFSSKCYLCGKPATKTLKLKDTFTSHSNACVPQSSRICDKCDWSINLRCFYYSPSKEKWGRLFSRNWSWLFQGDQLLSPNISDSHTEDKDTLSVVSNLPTRENIRDWLINPPEPPFTMAIAESGQKHILFLAQEAYNREIFPVQFELDSLQIDRRVLTDILAVYEKLMELGFTKTEINSGEYRSEPLMKCLTEWEPLESKLVKHRGNRFFELISYIARNKNK